MTPEEIVRRLAAITDPTVADINYAPASECGMCKAFDDDDKHTINNPAEHDAECPWRLAREWVAENDQ